MLKSIGYPNHQGEWIENWILKIVLSSYSVIFNHNEQQNEKKKKTFIGENKKDKEKKVNSLMKLLEE